MEMYVLDRTFSPIGVVDRYESTIWAQRYYEPGDFELYFPEMLIPDVLHLFAVGNYIYRPTTNQTCIVEKVQLTYDAETGKHWVVSGRDLKSLLARRVVWEQTVLSGDAGSEIQRLVSAQMISASDASRNIASLALAVPISVTGSIEKQITGDNLLDAVKEICQGFGWGYDITLGPTDFTKMYFDIFEGEDLSSSVIFSENYGNLSGMEYILDETNYANVARVAGEGEGQDRTIVTVGDASGLDRYEMWVDARNVSSNDGAYPPSQYQRMLQNVGLDKLAESLPTEQVSGDLLPDVQWKFGVDYKLGDIVGVEGPYGIMGKTRVTEIIESDAADGHTVIPTFSEWELVTND